MTIYKGGEIVANRYEILSFHDEGGMQEVYRALDKTFERVVALKVPKNQSAEKRFRRSAMLSALVNHHNVAKTLDFFEHDGREHLVEEFIVGRHVGGLLSQYGVLDPFLSAHVFHHIVKGVTASHEVDVFHRDLKPNNIMVSNEVWPAMAKVTDFGIATMAAESLNEAIEIGIPKSLSSSTLVGALPYMAPELIKDPKNAGKEADIWALGALLYEFMAGAKPYGEKLAAVAAILSGTLPPKPVPLGNNGQFTVTFEALWEIVTRCLQPAPALRPKAKDLAAVCETLCYSAYPRETGVIVRYPLDKKEAGFIRRQGGGGDVFFHRESFYGLMPVVGQKVVFSAFLGGDRPRAHPVIPIN